MRYRGYSDISDIFVAKMIKIFIITFLVILFFLIIGAIGLAFITLFIGSIFFIHTLWTE